MLYKQFVFVFVRIRSGRTKPEAFNNDGRLMLFTLEEQEEEKNKTNEDISVLSGCNVFLGFP